jgi:glyoxylase-like metal-dependent hydrolase (beta-lactamase superfamily II)
MKRAVVLSVIVLCGMTAASIRAVQEPLRETPIEVQRIGDNLYMLRGGGPLVRTGNVTIPASGNSLALVAGTGVVLVDSKLPGSGPASLQALRGVTDKPVTMIINTHTHGDHVGGNPDFPRTVDVIAQETTAALMREWRPVSGGRPEPNLFAGKNGQGLPTRTFKERMTIGKGNDQVELYFFGPAHTGGDTWVVFPAQRVAHVGDVFALKTFPIIDTNNGGSPMEYSRTISKALSALSEIDTVVTGHSPVPLSMSDLRLYGEFVDEFVQSMREAKRAGRSAKEYSVSWRLPTKYLDAGYVDTRPFVEQIWQDIDQ